MNWLWISGLVIVLDQVTKHIADSNLDLRVPLEVIPNLNMTLCYNKGAAFSILSNAGGWQRWVLMTISLVISIALVYWLHQADKNRKYLRWGLTLVIGGAVGNLEPPDGRGAASPLGLQGLPQTPEVHIARDGPDEIGLFGVGEEIPKGKIVYPIRNSLYLNLTNRCSNRCTFCWKNASYFVKGHDLELSREPDSRELLEAIGDPKRYSEVVFCGFGEPLLRLDLVKTVAAELKKKGGKIRIDTDGQANLVYGRNILPELKGLVDSVSVSLNAENAQKYHRICRSPFGEKGFEGVLDFLREARKVIPEVTATALTMPGVDLEACRRLAEEELGVKFRPRAYDEVG